VVLSSICDTATIFLGFLVNDQNLARGQCATKEKILRVINKTGAIETGCFFLSCDRRCEKIFKDMDRWSLLCGSVPRVKSNFETSFSKWKTTGSLQNLHHLIEHKKDYLMVCLSKNRVCRSTDRQTPCFYCASLKWFTGILITVSYDAKFQTKHTWYYYQVPGTYRYLFKQLTFRTVADLMISCYSSRCHTIVYVL